MNEVHQDGEGCSPENRKTADMWLPLVYGELRRVASVRLATEPPGQTIQPTALVHEAWLKLAGKLSDWNDRTHFFNAAAEAMRRILVDRARAKRRAKRGGDRVRVDQDPADLAHPTENEKLLLVDEALKELEAEDPVKARIVKFRYFAGRHHAEIGEALGISEKTGRRHWNQAKLRLFRKIKSFQQENR